MTELSKRISDRILSSDNFENVAYVCCDWEEFVFEVAEWGVDHIAQVDFDDLSKDDCVLTIANCIWQIDVLNQFTFKVNWRFRNPWRFNEL